MNERWRVALAGLVAALAIPFLIVDSPAPAEGVETSGQEDAPVEEAAELSAPEPEVVESADGPVAVEFVVTTEVITPDVTRLAAQAATWAVARDEAVADGLLEVRITPPPSNTNLALLPRVRVPEPEPVSDPVEPPPSEPDDAPDGEPTDEQPIEEDPPAEEPTEEPPAEEPPVEEDPPVEEEPPPVVEEPVDPDDAPDGDTGPAAPPQVDGRVPPPAGGPTGAQWDALRKCESTHNYRATNPSGQYRGAYQFSQVTWDWVAGIHWPHLVGIDPIDAEPAWQDVMAYTLYAMRGWDQWPICGRHLL